MNPFWIGGSILFLWALFLSFALGLRTEGFPRSDSQMRAVIGVSVLLTVIAISTAIIGASTGAGAGKGVRHGPEAPKHSN